MEQDEIQFPVSFNSCPNCGSTRRLVGDLLAKEAEKGRVPPGTKGCVLQQQTLIGDPATAMFGIPVVRTFFDVCADCGTVYCIEAHLGKAVQSATPNIPGGGHGLLGG